MNVAHCPMLMHSCAKYGMTKSKDKKLWPEHVKNLINLTLRSQVSFVSGS